MHVLLLLIPRRIGNQIKHYCDHNLAEKLIYYNRNHKTDDLICATQISIPTTSMAAATPQTKDEQIELHVVATCNH